MKPYTYYFVDGTKSTVMVEDALYEMLVEMDKQEKFGNRRETRRHVSVEKLVEYGVEPSYTDKHLLKDLLQNIEDPQVYDTVSSLTEAQKKLLTRLFCEGYTVTDIAEQDGVKVCSISNRLARIYKKFENFS